MGKIESRGVSRVVPTEQVVPNPWNTNEMTKTEMASLRESLEKYGQVESLTVRQLGDKLELLNGAHRLQLIKESGAEELAVRDMGVMPDDEAKHLSLILGATKGNLHWEKTRDLLHSFKKEYGWDPEQITRAIPNAEDMYSLNFDDDDGWIEEKRASDLPKKRTFEFRTTVEEGKVVDEVIARVKKSLPDRPSGAKAFLEMVRIASETVP